MIARLFADPDPILVKELRATFRTSVFVRFLYLSTALVALGVLSIGAAIASGDVPPATVGQALFQVFLGAGFLVLSVVAPAYSSAAITQEIEQETWESLLLSGMSARRIVLGKFAACHASIALVLVAFSPVVGLAFLFGGVSPAQVVVGFVSLLAALAPAVALGIAISARVRSTRVAIVLSTLIFVPIALTATAVVAALGESVRVSWGVGMPGPFFYTEVLVTRAGEWDTWVALLGAPLWAFGMSTWFLLAAAVAGVQPPGEHRSGAMKVWAVAMTLATAAVVAGAVAASGTTNDAVVASSFGAAVLVLFYAVVFCAEPVRPPRAWERGRGSMAPWRRALGVIGPGAAATMRFSIAWSAVTVAALVGSALAAATARGVPEKAVAAALVIAGGAVVLAAFVASLGALLRGLLRSGLAARVTAVSVLAAGALLPFLLALWTDPSSLDDLDRRSPLTLCLSAVHFLLVAARADDGNLDPVHFRELAISLGTYGVLAFAFFAAAELRCARERREARVRSAARAAEPA